MWLLSVSIIIFLIVIALIVYANWPESASSDCGCGAPRCQKCPCNKCGVPKKRCGCGPPPGGCPFC
jgi:hypothetical protein